MGLKLPCFALLVILAVAAASIADAAAFSSGRVQQGAVLVGRQLNGSLEAAVEEVEAEEWALPSEAARRLLLDNNKYVGYKALEKDKLAGGSGRAGGSYTRPCGDGTYNCRG